MSEIERLLFRATWATAKTSFMAPGVALKLSYDHGNGIRIDLLNGTGKIIQTFPYGEKGVVYGSPEAQEQLDAYVTSILDKHDLLRAKKAPEGKIFTDESGAKYKVIALQEEEQ